MPIHRCVFCVAHRLGERDDFQNTLPVSHIFSNHWHPLIVSQVCKIHRSCHAKIPLDHFTCCWLTGYLQVLSLESWWNCYFKRCFYGGNCWNLLEFDHVCSKTLIFSGREQTSVMSMLLLHDVVLRYAWQKSNIMHVKSWFRRKFWSWDEAVVLVDISRSWA